MIRSGIAAFAAIALATSAVSAGELAVDPTSGVLYPRGTFTNFGWTFTTSEARRVTSLAVWDWQSNGLVDDHPIAIWTLGGDLLISAVVTGADPLVPSISAAGGWRAKSINMALLPAGSYVIGAYYPTTADPFRGSSAQSQVSVNPAPWLVYGEDRFASGVEALDFPDGTLGGTFRPAFFGPNFQSLAVPEPATWTMLIAGFGLVGTALRRRTSLART